MALIKNIQLKNGAELEYHKINSVSVRDTRDDNEDVLVSISVDSYVSSDFRTANVNNTVESFIFDAVIKKEEAQKKGLYSTLYNYLKTTEMFKDAIDG